MVMSTWIGSTEVFNVHDKKACAGRPCVVHNQSDHAMRDWPRSWSVERMRAERLCPHGEIHIDPDDLAWREPDGDCAPYCDGCCDPPPMPTIDEAIEELLSMARDLQG